MAAAAAAAAAITGSVLALPPVLQASPRERPVLTAAWLRGCRKDCAEVGMPACTGFAGGGMPRMGSSSCTWVVFCRGRGMHPFLKLVEISADTTATWFLAREPRGEGPLVVSGRDTSDSCRWFQYVGRERTGKSTQGSAQQRKPNDRSSYAPRFFLMALFLPGAWLGTLVW